MNGLKGMIAKKMFGKKKKSAVKSNVAAKAASEDALDKGVDNASENPDGTSKMPKGIAVGKKIKF